MFNLGMGEITIILMLALIFIGPKKLPELASGLGKLIREIRKTTSDVKNEIQLDEAIRKPFEELREAVTLHPDELKRRDRLRKELEDIQRRAAENINSATGEPQTTGEPVAGETPSAWDGATETDTGTMTAATTGDQTVTASDDVVHAGTPPRPAEAAATHAIRRDSASQAVVDAARERAASSPLPNSATDRAAAVITPPPVLAPAVPGAAPLGTIARDPSSPNAPPAPPLAAVLTKSALERKIVSPPSGSDFLRSLRAVPESRKPIPGRLTSAEPGAADRGNTTQTLTEADLAAITVGPPPTPPGQTGRTPAPPARLPGATPPKNPNH